MSWFAISGLILLGLILCGFLLPKTYAGEATRVIAAPIERVWELMTDPERTPIAGPMAHAVTLTDDGWTEDLGSSVVTVVVTESSPPHRLVRELADNSLPMTALNIVTLEARSESETRAHVQHTVTIRLGTWHVPVFRWVMLVTRGASSVPYMWLEDIEDQLKEAASPAPPAT